MTAMKLPNELRIGLTIVVGLSAFALAMHRLFTAANPRTGPDASAVAHRWLIDLQVEYSTVACSRERTGDLINRPYPVACNVRLDSGDIATIVCANTHPDATGCSPYNANDQLLLTRAYRRGER